MRSGRLEHFFPELAAEPYDITSPATDVYNCIAHAAGDDQKNWWPGPDHYWPDGMPLGDSVENFVRAFSNTLGYEACADGDLQDNYEKLAIYAIEGKTKHMSRQLPDGSWTSKLGQERDISHTLKGIEGVQYGNVAGYLRREKQRPVTSS